MWLVASAVAADVGIPLDPMSSLPWEVAATSLCGETIDVDGERVLHRWWVRDGNGRLSKIVVQRVGSASLTEERFGYDAAGRLVRVEAWRTSSAGLELDQLTEYQRDAAGRQIAQRHVVPARYGSPAREETSPVVVDAAGHEVRDGHVRDRRGRLIRVMNGTNVFQTIEWAPDGLSARMTLDDGLVVQWVLDRDGVPVSATSPVNRTETEVVRWHRDCSQFPPVPTAPAQP